MSNIPLMKEEYVDFVMILRLDTTWTLHISGEPFSTVVGTPGPFSFLKKNVTKFSRCQKQIIDILGQKQLSSTTKTIAEKRATRRVASGSSEDELQANIDDLLYTCNNYRQVFELPRSQWIATTTNYQNYHFKQH